MPAGGGRRKSRSPNHFRGDGHPATRRGTDKWPQNVDFRHALIATQTKSCVGSSGDPMESRSERPPGLRGSEPGRCITGWTGGARTHLAVPPHAAGAAVAGVQYPVGSSAELPALGTDRFHLTVPSALRYRRRGAPTPRIKLPYEAGHLRDESTEAVRLPGGRPMRDPLFAFSRRRRAISVPAWEGRGRVQKVLSAHALRSSVPAGNGHPVTRLRGTLRPAAPKRFAQFGGQANRKLETRDSQSPNGARDLESGRRSLRALKSSDREQSAKPRHMRLTVA